MLFMLFLMLFFLLFLQDLSKRIPVTARAPLLIGRPAAGEFLSPFLTISFFLYTPIYMHVGRHSILFILIVL